MSQLLSDDPIVCFGEILWDVLPGGRFPGGAPLNVAYHLQKLGNRTAMISRFGLDDEGKKLIDLIDSYGIGTEHFQLDEEWPTGKVLATVLENEEVRYDILQPVAWDYIQWEEGFETIVSKAPYLVFGSLATRSPVSRNTLFRLLEVAPRRVLDANLRPPFYSREVIEKLFTGLHLLKLNSAELELVTGWFSPYKTDMERIKILQDRFAIPSIVVTKGSKGALFNVEGSVYEHPGFPVDVVDAVGSGDAFLAALLTQLSAGKSPLEALRFANATGALVATQRGACPAYDRAQIDHLLKLESPVS
jgi:fructokinase